MFSHKFILFLVGLAVTVAVNADEQEIVSKRPRYHVDILKANDDESLEHLCDGAILDSRYVITAAHCIHSLEVSQLRVRSGSDVAPPPDMPHHEKRLFHRVVKAMLPADYVHLPCRAHEHDIAILKVNRVFDLAYDKLYKQINLPEASNDYEGYETTVSGYINEKLNTFEAKVISNEHCSKSATSIVTRGNVCGIVNGDFKINDGVSGSPLVYQNTLVGIMNAPSKCSNSSERRTGIKCVAQPPSLKLYTRVSVYLDFVNKVLNNVLSSDIVYRS